MSSIASATLKMANERCTAPASRCFENGKADAATSATPWISPSRRIRPRSCSVAKRTWRKLKGSVTPGASGGMFHTGEIYWSDETFRIFELDPKTEITIELIVQRTHPDDRQAVQQVIERASRDRTEFALEHRLLMPDGSDQVSSRSSVTHRQMKDAAPNSWAR